MFSNIRATFPGGGTAEDANDVVAELTPQILANHWPEISSLQKTVPASGLFARHVAGITLTNVVFDTTAPDARPAVVFSDVTGGETDKAIVPVVRP